MKSKNVSENQSTKKRQKALSLCFFSHSAGLGGAERTLLELTTELIEDYGVICTVILPEDGPLKKKLEAIGVFIHIVDYSWWYDSKILPDEQVTARCTNSAKNLLYSLKQVLCRINPDIVVTNTMSIPWGAIAASFLGKPHVWFIHEFGESDHGLKSFLPPNITLKAIKNLSTIILTNSEAVRKKLFPNVSKEKVLTVYQYINIPPTAIYQNENKYFTRANSTKLIISASVHEGKGQKDAILAVKKLVQRSRDIELIIMGHCTSRYAEYLKAIVKQKGLKSHVKLIGFKENPYPIMNQADIGIICSRNEAFGRVTIEGMLLKKPVIGTNRGGTLELIKDGFNGLLYEYSNYNQLADKIEYLIEHPEKARRLAENGYRFAKKTFTRNNFGGKIYKLLLNLKVKTNPEISFPDLRLEGPGLLDSLLTAAACKNQKIAALITELGSSLKAKDSQITELTNSLQDKVTQISRLEPQIQQIQQSIVMQLVNRYHKVMERVLRPGTRRRHYYELGLTGMRIILNAGCRSFWYKLKHWFSSRRNLQKLTGQSSSYQLWIAQNEPKAKELEQQKQELLSFTYRPKISIITPVWNPEAKWLKAAIESVINQTYDNWELCLADGNSTKPQVKQTLKDYTSKDSRIKVKFLPENKGISGNSNEALLLAAGEYVALLDCDDELAPFALFEIARLLNTDASLNIIYSDEDKIDIKGNRFDPYFKPDWSPDLLHSGMYTGHLSVYRRKFLLELGGFRSVFDFSQDYDLMLRASEKTKCIAHIPEVLYHWRAVPGSGAADGKAFAKTSYIAALQSAVKRRGYRAKAIIAPPPYHVNRIVYDPLDYPLVSIVIPTDDTHSIFSCIDSVIKKSSYPNLEIIVVTNSNLANILLQHYTSEPRIRVSTFDKPFNFSAKCNLGASEARGDFLLFLNCDIEVIESNWLEEMIGFFQRPEVGAVGPKLVYPDNTIQDAGLITGVRGFIGTAFHGQSKNSFGYFGYIQSTRNVSALSGACLLIPKQLFKSVGGFNEINTPIWHQDVDLCFRLREKRYLLVYTPFACLKHTAHVSIKKRGLLEQGWSSDLYLLKRWPSFISNDPYCTRNMYHFLCDDPIDYRIIVNEKIALGRAGRNILFANNDSAASAPATLTYRLASYLVQRGNFVTVVTPTRGKLVDKYKKEGIPVIIDGSVIENPFSSSATRRFLVGFDLVIISTIFSWRVVLASKQKNVPVLWLIYESDAEANLVKFNTDIIKAMNAADVVVFPSHLTAAPYKEFQKTDNFEVVPVETKSSEYEDRIWKIFSKRIDNLKVK